jgi:hypothetical protein
VVSGSERGRERGGERERESGDLTSFRRLVGLSRLQSSFFPHTYQSARAVSDTLVHLLLVHLLLAHRRQPHSTAAPVAAAYRPASRRLLNAEKIIFSTSEDITSFLEQTRVIFTPRSTSICLHTSNT